MGAIRWNAMRMHVALALAVGCLLGLATWAAAWSSVPPTAQAQGSLIRYVAPTGADAGDCAVSAHPCATVQYAVDRAATGDEVHIATGVYTDVHQRAGITQTVYLTKTVTLRGGYPAGFSGPPDPDAHPTTLDARGRGRVLYIIGNITPTIIIEGLRITGGNAAGLGGGPYYGKDAGGGIYVLVGGITIHNNHIFSNTAPVHGGGLFLIHSYGPTMLSQNTITANTATTGGGLHLFQGRATLIGNTIITNTALRGGGLFLNHNYYTVLNSNTIAANTAQHDGGGLYAEESSSTFIGNMIVDNAAGYYGGGVTIKDGGSTFNGNTITRNVAKYGGGLWLIYTTVALSGDTIAANTAEHGGGLAIGQSGAALTNAVIVNNRAYVDGGGLYIEDASSASLQHVTIAYNGSAGPIGKDSNGICVTNIGPFHGSAVLNNIILVSHTVGISVTGGNTVTVNGVLWHDTPITISQAATATVTVQNQHWGNPAFLNPTAGDYHIGPTSAARDTGIDAGVHTDIDGEPRPYQLPDIGADEYWPPGALKRLYLPLIWRS